MNTLPILALATVASGYAASTARLDDYFNSLPEPAAEIMAWPAAPATGLSVYDMPGTVPGHEMLAYDQPHCGVDAELTRALSQDFQEQKIDTRTRADGLLFDLYTSADMGTWTLVHRGDDGVSCVVSSGTGWTDAATPDQIFDQADLAT
jgi:hypothetical protein